MSGRYSFSLPERRERDGWFKLGSIDVTTTAFIVIVGVLSMVLYAIDPSIVAKGVFNTELVRDGEFWRVATWPLMNPPIQVWDLITLAIFWFLGHWIEDETGKKAWAVIVAAMTIIPAIIVTLLNVSNDLSGRWSAGSFSVFLLSLAAISIYGIDRPNVRFFFGIPAWVIAAAYVFIEVLRDVGNRAWAQLILVLLVILVGCFGAAQRGWLMDYAWIPRVRRWAPKYSPYGDVGTKRPRSKGRWRGRPKRSGGGGTGSVVAGPWGQQPEPSGRTPVEEAELDILLDKIGAGGLDSLTPDEQARLKDLSKRKKGS